MGNLLQLCLLRRLQEAGHRPIALAGGGTGFIGDPSGTSDERNLLSPEELAENVAGIRGQMARFFDFTDVAGRTKAALLENADLAHLDQPDRRSFATSASTSP